MEFATIVRLNWDNRNSETARCANTERPLTHPSDYTGRQAVTESTCSVEGCTLTKRITRGMCSGHYQRWIRTGDVGSAQVQTKSRAKLPCGVDGCGKVATAKGLCVAHRLQQKRGKDLTPLLKQISRTDRDDRGRKWCERCCVWLEEARFGKSAAASDGLQPRCKDCARYAVRKTLFNVTVAQLEAMHKAQGGVCAICHRPNADGRALAVDHDHSCCPGNRSCGKCVRALLCSPCNSFIGLAGDSPSRLRAGAAYLERHRGEAT